MPAYQSYLHITHYAGHIARGFLGPGHISIFEMKDSFAIVQRNMNTMVLAPNLALATARHYSGRSHIQRLEQLSRLPVLSLSISRSEQRVTGMVYTKPGNPKLLTNSFTSF